MKRKSTPLTAYASIEHKEAAEKLPEKEVKALPFEITSVKSEVVNGVEVGIIEGYASTWDKDRGDDIILKGAFTDSIKEHKEKERPIRMLYQHSSMNLIGGFPIDSLREDEKGLFVRGEINLTKGQQGEFAYSLAKQGVLTDMSIGFSIMSREDVDFKDDGEDVIRVIKKLALREISLVGEPMNERANITQVKNEQKVTAEQIDSCKSIGDVEDLLKSVGFSSKARKKLVSFIKCSKDCDGSNEQDDSTRDEMKSEDQKQLEGIASRLDSFNKQQQIDALVKKLN